MFKERIKFHHISSERLKKFSKRKDITETDFYMVLEKEVTGKTPKAIYVHTPYCDKICSFCNLNREKLNGKLEEYAIYISNEFKKYGKTRYFKDQSFQVIYFGGGTPTVYKFNELEIILKSIKENVKLDSDYEFTFESTLHNLNKKKLKLMMDYGVNRISIGIQSFSQKGREFYNRTFNKEQAIEKLKEIKTFFKGDICIDIIYNYPGQEEKDIIEDAKLIKEMGISSSSFYSLMIHEGSNLSKDIKEKKIKMNNDLNNEKKLHDLFIKELCNDGEYYLLELTKLAKKGGDNYKYIKVRNSGGDTFPIGVGAGGNIGNIGIYRMSKERTFFNYRDEMLKKYSLISGLMQFPKIGLQQIKKLLSKEEYRYFIEKITEYKEKGLIKRDKESLELTDEGVFWGNNISKGVIDYIVECFLES